MKTHLIKKALHNCRAFFMRKQFILLLTILFCNQFLYSQKIIEREFSFNEIETLLLHDNLSSSIVIKSSPRSNIVVRLHNAGENSENIILKEEVIDKTLSLTSMFSPFFIKINDKLAAHKVLSIEYEIEVPEFIKIDIQSKLASVKIYGCFKDARIMLNEGNCNLINYCGNANIQTKMGDIHIKSSQQAIGKAFSKYGKVKNLLEKGENIILAESIHGDIIMIEN